MNFFTDGFEELHNEEQQLARQDKSSEVEIDWLPKLNENGQPILTPKGNVSKKFLCNGRLKTCRISDYLVSLHWCSCRDFQLRKVPCKHMYKLASRLGVFAKKEVRTQNLIADFSKGFTDGWAFLARPCNYGSLDITWQTTVVGGQKQAKSGGRKSAESTGKSLVKKRVLTQGNRYNFSMGEVFYDDVAGYTEIWRDALQKINMLVQVDSSTATTSMPMVKWDGKRYVRKEMPFFGFVDFSVYTPNSERTRLEKRASYSCRQDEFVNLLKTGTFADKNGEIITLKE